MIHFICILFHTSGVPSYHTIPYYISFPFHTHWNKKSIHLWRKLYTVLYAVRYVMLVNNFPIYFLNSLFLMRRNYLNVKCTWNALMQGVNASESTTEPEWGHWKRQSLIEYYTMLHNVKPCLPANEKNVLAVITFL